MKGLTQNKRKNTQNIIEEQEDWTIFLLEVNFTSQMLCCKWDMDQPHMSALFKSHILRHAKTP